MTKSPKSRETSSNPRVLWLIPTLSSRFGGPTTTATNGAVAERAEGLLTEVATTVGPDGPGDSKAALDRLEAAGVPTHAFPRRGSSASLESWGVSLAMSIWILRKVSTFDVVHLQYVWCLSSLLGCLAAKANGIPVVLTPHESLTAYDTEVASRSGSKKLLKKILRHLYLRTVDRIIFMSELEERDTDAGNRATVRIGHAVAERTFADDRESSDSSELPMKIGFIGRNIPKKGIDRLIRALACHPELGWHLLVAGPPGTDEFVTEQSELSKSLGVDDRVEWLGFVDDRTEFFRRCDILAMPSEYEGFGMVAAEAMSHGLPVVVPERTGVSEIVSEFGAGIVIADPSVPNLSAALLEFDEQREAWPTFSRNGLRAVDQRLTFRAYGSSLRGLYSTLI